MKISRIIASVFFASVFLCLAFIVTDANTGEFVESTALVVNRCYDEDSVSGNGIIHRHDNADYFLDLELEDGSVLATEVDQAYWHRVSRGAVIRVTWIYGHWTRRMYNFRIAEGNYPPMIYQHVCNF